MTRNKIIVCLALLVTCAVAFAQDGSQQEPPKPEELAVKEVERLERALGLEDWQTFYIDSVLVHNYSELFKEIDALQRARVENSDLYLAIQDKWMIRTEEAYKKFFTPAQWEEYLRQGGQRIINDREKRKMKAAGIKPEKKKKKKK